MIWLAVLLVALSAAPGAQEPATPIAWAEVLAQKEAWYGSPEALRIADNVLCWQRDCGGWPKNEDMAVVLTDAQRASLLAQHADTMATIDNGATHTQLAFLARVQTAQPQDRLRASFDRGLDYLLAAQYANGGWPQFYPLRRGYWSHITFNDDAMVGVLRALEPIARGEAPYAFVDAARRQKAKDALAKGIDCILACQVKVDGVLTAWCAQHDEQTLAPAAARKYELVSLSGAESVPIVRFLMTLPTTPRVVAAVEGAVAWLEKVKLTGIKVVEIKDAKLPGGKDRAVQQDPAAPPLWARFYEIGTNQPIFCDRDGIARQHLADIGHERRNGYAWYVDRPRDLLARDLPAWRARSDEVGKP
ncbi:MAG: pectate lyase [Armatimonadetes bacterium]|nr:pectate lyase [Armatimonadota bacterium]